MAEGAGLECQCGRKFTVGSNPTLSAHGPGTPVFMPRATSLSPNPPGPEGSNGNESAGARGSFFGLDRFEVLMVEPAMGSRPKERLEAQPKGEPRTESHLGGEEPPFKETEAGAGE